jgi:signal transduction histidine kinase
MTQLRSVRWLRDHPTAADAVLAGVLAVPSVVAHLAVREPDYRDPSVIGLLLVLGATVPLVWRRRAPGTVLFAIMTCQFLVVAHDWIGTGWLNLLVAAYTLGTLRSGRVLWWLGGISTLGVLGFITFGVVNHDVQWQAMVSTTVLFATAIILGDNMRRRRERAAELVERAERAERERELVATQRVQQERTRIARELHDVVAHSVSVMIIQAGAARRQVASNPQQAIDVLETIEQTGRQAMSEMRRVLGVLRSDGNDGNDGSDGVEGSASARAPQPSLTSLGDLVSASDDLPVSLHTEGTIDGLPPGVELSAYRVVQEALTNVRRHAGRVDRVDVAVTHADEALVVEVTDDGRGASSVHPSAGQPGYGIAGMRERVSMFGGSLNAGPRQGGGWRVRATFPLHEPVGPRR